MNKNNIQLMGVLETRIRETHSHIIPQSFGQHWSYVHNLDLASNMRVLLLWKDRDIEVQIVHRSDQFIHSLVKSRAGDTKCTVTFIYVRNTVEERASLWHQLLELQRQVDGPWLALGDLNVVLDETEKRTTSGLVQGVGNS